MWSQNNANSISFGAKALFVVVILGLGAITALHSYFYAKPSQDVAPLEGRFSEQLTHLEESARIWAKKLDHTKQLLDHHKLALHGSKKPSHGPITVRTFLEKDQAWIHLNQRKELYDSPIILGAGILIEAPGFRYNEMQLKTFSEPKHSKQKARKSVSIGAPVVTTWRANGKRFLSYRKRLDDYENKKVWTQLVLDADLLEK